MLARNNGMPTPASWWIIVCISAYICLRLPTSSSARATNSNWSNRSDFQRDSFQAESDLKNWVRMVSAVGRALMFPKPTSLLSQCLDQ
ncbi:hypothetical protein D3C72_2064690 [compost metagenome]